MSRTTPSWTLAAATAVLTLATACTAEPAATDEAVAATPTPTAAPTVAPVATETPAPPTATATAELTPTPAASESAAASDGPGDPGDIEEQLATTDVEIAGLMADFDSDDWPDGPPPSSEFSSSFADDERIWLIYKLDDGVSDTVVIRWQTADGTPLVEEATFDYMEEHTWAWAWIDPPPTGFSSGERQAVIELEGSGDRVVIPFQISE